MTLTLDWFINVCIDMIRRSYDAVRAISTLFPTIIFPLIDAFK